MFDVCVYGSGCPTGSSTLALAESERDRRTSRQPRTWYTTARFDLEAQKSRWGCVTEDPEAAAAEAEAAATESSANQHRAASHDERRI